MLRNGFTVAVVLPVKATSLHPMTLFITATTHDHRLIMIQENDAIRDDKKRRLLRRWSPKNKREVFRFQCTTAELVVHKAHTRSLHILTSLVAHMMICRTA